MGKLFYFLYVKSRLPVAGENSPVDGIWLMMGLRPTQWASWRCRWLPGKISSGSDLADDGPSADAVGVLALPLVAGQNIQRQRFG